MIHRLLSDDIQKAVQFNVLNLDRYQFDESFEKGDYIMDLNNILREFNEIYCHALAESLCDLNDSYARGMMLVYASNTIKPDPAI